MVVFRRVFNKAAKVLALDEADVQKIEEAAHDMSAKNDPIYDPNYDICLKGSSRVPYRVKNHLFIEQQVVKSDDGDKTKIISPRLRNAEA